jgi:hypothetical protein
MSNPKNALQERLAKFKGEHSIVYSDVTSAGSTFQCTLSATLTWQGVTKQWTATSLRSRCSKKESHFETAELLLQDKDLLLHCSVANWDVPGGSHEQITRPVTFASGMSGNFKTRLNELAMKARVECRYETTSMAPFLSRITIDRPSTEESITITGAEAGTKKKAAEQSAAARALNDAGVRAMLGIEESLGPAVNAVGGADNTHNVEGYLKRPVPTRSVLDSAADVYVDTAAELVSASATASPEPAQLVQPPPDSPQQLPHNTASATAVQPHPSTLTNPKGHLLELFAKNLTRLVALPGAMHKSPVFSTSASAPFVATVTIGTPQGDIALVGPACTTKKAAEQSAAALALADSRVRALLYLPPLQPEPVRADVNHSRPHAPAAPSTATAPEPTTAQEDTVPIEQECAPLVPDAELSYPALSQHTTDNHSFNTTTATTTAVTDTTVMPSTAPASTTVTTNPKGRLLEMSAQAGLGLTRGPQFSCTATAPFIATISIGSPQGATVLTGPGCGTKKAAEQAVAALALADTRVTQLLHPPTARVQNTETVAADAFSVTPSYVSENTSGPVSMTPLNCVTNSKGRLLELCAKLPLSNRCQAQFQTTVTAPFISTLLLNPHNIAITGPDCTTKKSAEQAVAAIALQDVSIQRLLGLVQAPAVATEDDGATGAIVDSDDVGLHNN